MAAWFIAPAKGVLFLMVISTRGRIPGLLNLAPSGAAFYLTISELPPHRRRTLGPSVPTLQVLFGGILLTKPREIAPLFAKSDESGGIGMLPMF
jgi:hypothetical protein